MHEKHAVPPLPHKAIDSRLASRLRPASPGRIEGIDLVGLGNPTGPEPAQFETGTRLGLTHLGTIPWLWHACASEGLVARTARPWEAMAADSSENAIPGMLP
jgi:hypothetical protein